MPVYCVTPGRITHKKAAPNIGAAFRFYPHHFKTGNQVVAGS